MDGVHLCLSLGEELHLGKGFVREHLICRQWLDGFGVNYGSGVAFFSSEWGVQGVMGGRASGVTRELDRSGRRREGEGCHVCGGYVVHTGGTIQ